MPSAMLTVKEAAARLGLSETSVYALCNGGKLKHYRFGASKRGTVRIDAAGMEAYIFTCAVTVTPVEVQERRRSGLNPAAFSRLR